MTKKQNDQLEVRDKPAKVEQADFS